MAVKMAVNGSIQPQCSCPKSASRLWPIIVGQRSLLRGLQLPGAYWETPPTPKWGDFIVSIVSMDAASSIPIALIGVSAETRGSS
jgi:hypothetical protein